MKILQFLLLLVLVPILLMGADCPGGATHSRTIPVHFINNDSVDVHMYRGTAADDSDESRVNAGTTSIRQTGFEFGGSPSTPHDSTFSVLRPGEFHNQETFSMSFNDLAPDGTYLKVTWDGNTQTFEIVHP